MWLVINTPVCVRFRFLFSVFVMLCFERDRACLNVHIVEMLSKQLLLLLPFTTQD